MQITIAIIEFPGTNCERESAEAVRRCGMLPLFFRWNEDTARLRQCDGYLIPGGFSYEDRSRSGILAALDPVLDILKQESAKGKPVLGICNGAQILVESGLVPGLAGYRLGCALAENKRVEDNQTVSTGFHNVWIDAIHTPGDQSLPNAFTTLLHSGQSIHIPAAHAEGRFVIPPQVLQQMEKKGMTVFRYARNPNGSVADLAGICNCHGNVLALMPHPERSVEGDTIFNSMRGYIERHQAKGWTEGFLPDFRIDADWEEATNRMDIPRFKAVDGDRSRELIIGTLITDNSAVSVEQALRNKGIAVAVRRYMHWELTVAPGVSKKESDSIEETACASGALFNANKEFRTVLDTPPQARTFLVRSLEGEDFHGSHAFKVLKDWFGIQQFTSVAHGVLWTLIPDTTDPQEAIKTIEAAEKTHIMANPFSQRRFLYD
ncbi:MAG: phosphoribosylformylglycinamidine synthase I [Sphaerochaetaceae bacterium]